MKKPEIFFILMVAVVFSTAQNSQHARIIKNSRGIIQSAEFDLNDKNQLTPKSSADFFKEWLKVSPDVEFVKESFNEPDKQGYSDEHYDQYYKGIKVKNGGYNFHYKMVKCILHMGTMLTGRMEFTWCG